MGSVVYRCYHIPSSLPPEIHFPVLVQLHYLNPLQWASPTPASLFASLPSIFFIMIVFLKPSAHCLPETVLDTETQGHLAHTHCSRKPLLVYLPTSCPATPTTPQMPHAAPHSQTPGSAQDTLLHGYLVNITLFFNRQLSCALVVDSYFLAYFPLYHLEMSQRVCYLFVVPPRSAVVPPGSPWNKERTRKQQSDLHIQNLDCTVRIVTFLDAFYPWFSLCLPLRSGGGDMLYV